MSNVTNILILCLFTVLISLTQPASTWAADTIKNPTITRMIGEVNILRGKSFIRASMGMPLQRGDEVRTSRRGKIYIDFPDNSRVKLGNFARFQVRDWQENEGIFSSILRVSQGAFRYTAGLLRAGLKQRNTELSTRTAVLGVRGTDFWGRVGQDNTFFLLLEGSVTLAPRLGDSITYNQAGFAVNIDNNEISEPSALKQVEIAPLAAETEIATETETE